MNRRIAVLALLAFASGCAHGSAPLPASAFGSAALTASPKDLLAATAVPPPKDADSRVFFEQAHYTVDAQGRMTYELWRVYQLLTSDGIKNLGTVQASWAPWYQDKPTLSARVVTPDGKVHPLDPTAISEAPARQDASGQMMSDVRVLRAPLPSLTPGAVVETRVRVVDRQPEFPHGTSGRFYLGEGVPVAHTQVIVDVPASTPLVYKVLGASYSPKVTVSGGRQRVSLDLGKLPAYDTDESMLPPDQIEWPFFAFATGDSWHTLANDYEQIVANRIAGAKLGPMVQKATAGAKGRVAIIDRLLSRVLSKVRYTGVELGDAAIVPRTPAETLARGFGDCKDKATLLVALLHAAGIEAHVALLRAGTEEDVQPDLPALGVFDHAIVYVPGKPGLWVDPTSTWRPVGGLPLGDGGRLALIAAAGTTKLTQTPPAHSSDNVMIEDRDITLADEGPGRLVIEKRVKGAIAEAYRRSLAETSHDGLQKQFEGFVQNNYLAKALDRLDVSDPHDFTAPVVLRFEMDHAKRGLTDGVKESVAALQHDGLFFYLPDFLTGPADASAPLRKFDLQLSEPFVAEVHYRIVPPAGYTLRETPRSGGFEVGTAHFSKSFSVDKDGVVKADYVFDTGDGRFTPSEARELHIKVHAEVAKTPSLVLFDLAPAKDLRDGKIKEGLAGYRKLLAQGGKKALHQAQLASALIKLDLGDLSRTHAQEAVKLDPKSGFAWRTLGWILQHDRFGRLHHAGFDRKGAIEAYDHALAIDDHDLTAYQNLGALYELGNDGIAFGKGCQLDLAVANYKKAADVLGSDRFADAELVDLVRAGHYDDATKFAASLSGTTRRRALLLVAVTLRDGLPAALSRAKQLVADPDDRKALLRVVGATLLQLRNYDPALALLRRLDQSTKDVLGPFLDVDKKHLSRWEDVDEGTGPGAVVHKLVPLMLVRSDKAFTEKVRPMLSRRVGDVDTVAVGFRIPGLDEVQASLPTSVSRVVVVDILASLAKARVKGDVEGVYRVKLGAEDKPDGLGTYYVVKEDGGYRLLGSGFVVSPVGAVALQAAKKGKTADAKKLLDWIFSGPAKERELLKNVWSTGDTHGKRAVLLAAARVVAAGSKPKPAIPVLRKALKHMHKNDAARDGATLSLAVALDETKHYKQALRIVDRLVKKHPGKKMYRALRADCLRSLHREKELAQGERKWLAAHPDDPTSLQVLGHLAERQGRFTDAVKRFTVLAKMDETKPVADNEIAWLTLFGVGNLASGVTKAKEAARLSENSDPAILNTLAALEAESGDYAAAQASLEKTLSLEPNEEPGPADWYVIARLEEAYGFTDAARRDYAKAKDPADATQPAAAWALAKKRLATLQHKTGAGSSRAR